MNPLINPLIESSKNPLTDPLTRVLARPLTNPLTRALIGPLADPLARPLTNPLIESSKNPLTDPLMKPAHARSDLHNERVGQQGMSGFTGPLTGPAWGMKKGPPRKLRDGPSLRRSASGVQECVTPVPRELARL